MMFLGGEYTVFVSQLRLFLKVIFAEVTQHVYIVQNLFITRLNKRWFQDVTAVLSTFRRY
jgi:hypothetical protein